MLRKHVRMLLVLLSCEMLLTGVQIVSCYSERVWILEKARFYRKTELRWGNDLIKIHSNKLKESLMCLLVRK